jgi:outer membrane protein assembly factor BamA
MVRPGWRLALGWILGWMLLAGVSVGTAAMAQGQPALPTSPLASQTAPAASRTAPTVSQTAPAASQYPSTTPAAAAEDVTASPTQSSVEQAAAAREAAKQASDQAAAARTIAQFRGLRVSAIQFEGVTFTAADPLPGQLPLKVGEPLDQGKVRQSMQQLFASGLYRDISVNAEGAGQGVTVIFVGTPRYFVGRVSIVGVKEDRLAALLEYATNLTPGGPFTEAAIAAGTAGARASLETNGYYEATIMPKTEVDETGRQVNVTYTVAIGAQARVGQVAVEGDAGMTATEFRKQAKLKERSKVTRDTTLNALTRVRAKYEKEDRLEAVATVQKETYNTPRKQVDYDFKANRGPLVKVVVEGFALSKSRLHLLVPIFQEGTIDNDLLNEGTYNIKDFLFQEGYFDATVSVKVMGEKTTSQSVVYSVVKGERHKVGQVNVTGNRYFSTDLLKERMKVQKADLYLRSGRYSPELMKGDVSSILALYRANGFSAAHIDTAAKDVDTNQQGKPLKVGEIAVTVKITEGPQQKFGPVTLSGVADSRLKEVGALLNSQQGQPFSLISLSGDRDALLGYYLSRGFEQAKIEVRQEIEEGDPAKVDVTLAVTEGQQVFIDRVLLSGIQHVRPSTIANQVKVKAGSPLDQSALLETQRNLYNLALFNEVVSNVQNPDGDESRKNVLLQLTEAKRWDVTYGFGFEAATGEPTEGVINPASAILLGLNPNQSYAQNGKTGVSPRISLDVSRISLRGTDQSLTLHATYGLLEEVATLTLQSPHFLGKPTLTSSISGGYSNVQNIATFQASTLQGDYRVTQKVRRTDTFIYNFEFRRVAVNPATLEVSANLIPQLSQPVRVGGPGITWFHDKREPTPLDATKGSYTSVQEFFASSKFGSQSSFIRSDVTNSTYWSFGKHKYTLARNTRFGFENKFGPNPNTTSVSCVGGLLETNASCNAVPLPERLYAGGATSHRGFGINDAGPRDLQTGYPVGGNAVIVNTVELRLPPPVLPFVGDSISFVLFHDMGNVFTHISDAFPSVARFHQPDQASCANVNVTSAYPFGTCNFNYFSHAVGAGARYHTPVGPIRVDFSYNLNPPVYPVIYDFNGNPPYEGQANHFNFFFSIGQSF